MATGSTSHSPIPPLVDGMLKMTDPPTDRPNEPSVGSYVFSIDSNFSQSNASSDGQSTGNDKFAHTRTKRKRTSREDFATLEAEYQKSSRPDKATRNDIVGRVALSEKEVQIWFQNRRQMTRRKGRTWQPNEITSIIRSSQEISGGESSPNDLSFSSSQTYSSQASEPGESLGAEREEHLAPEFLDLVKQSRSRALVPSTVNIVTGPTPEPQKTDRKSSTTLQHQIDPALHNVQEKRDEQEVNSQEQKPAVESPRKRVKRASSIRLSMSLDGKAQVVTDGCTPSPPSKLQTLSDSSRRSGGLQRSQSSISPGEKRLPDVVNISSPWPPLRPHGRSRDARTWEFYCDSDARDALTKTAEHEQNGSALGAIGLIRSGSAGRGPLAPSAGKQNSQLQRQDSGKRKSGNKSESNNRKLARTISSYARLQGAGKRLEMETQDKALKPGLQSVTWEDPFGDSDKENWMPGTHSTRPRGEITGSRPLDIGQRNVLQENTRVPSHSSSLEAMMAKDKLKSGRQQKKKLAAINAGKESVEVNEEVSAFMGEPRIAREEDELDAVQNLLSLSQGAWQ